jgi:hypothetical protein
LWLAQVDYIVLLSISNPWEGRLAQNIIGISVITQFLTVNDFILVAFVAVQLKDKP